MSAEVFISYAAKDRERVAKLVEGLQQAGVSVWIDMAGIEVAAMWSKEIVSAIRECKVLLLSISPQSTESENVVKELALASERKKPIIPIYLEPAEIPETMEYQLAGIQRVEFYEGREEIALQAVIRALAKLGVKVADEASAAAAGVPNIAAHGISHSGAGQMKASEAGAWRKIAVAVGVVAVLAAGLFFLGGSGSETTAPLGQAGTNVTNTTEQTQPLAKPVTLDTNRVVVLPFKTIGTSGETADLGYGLVSTLTSKLQPLQNLVVIANESAWNYEGSKLSPKEIGQALEVGRIVTGEIQTSGDKVQVNIRVIDANTAALGWGSTFTKTKDEFLDLQNEIATQLASELKGGLDATEAQQLAQKATENAEAQAEYQAGRREWNKRSKEGFENAIRHFEQAIEIDPNYANPYAGLADTYALYPNYNFSIPDVAMPKAKEYAQKAIEINPNTAEAYTSLAFVLCMYEHKWKLAEENYKKAIELNPNYPTGYHWYGIFLTHTGRSDEAIPLLIKGTQLDPNAMIIKNGLSLSYWCSGQKEMALKTVDKEFQFDPYFSPGLHTKYGYLLSDTSEKAVNHLNEAIKVYPNQPLIRWSLFNVHWAAGNSELAKDQLIELHARFNDSLGKTRFAELYFTMGKEDVAYQWLEKGIEAKEGMILFACSMPSLKKYQSQPRFRELFKTINHPMYVD
ncbi:MAG: tetratricopeptide repeat protein [Verrucomicrobiota bacterium]|nr:tetratricopeptide repeat protein [Verrucomicrobiota bacterium]